MRTGIVKFYNESKGFGFITDEESQSDIFVHATGIIDQIKQDDRVQFETRPSKKDNNKSEAFNVKRQ